MNTRGQALLNAYLNRYVNAQRSTVNSGNSNATSAAKTGISVMNSQDMSLPALDDYTTEVYSGIIENGKSQMEAAQKAMEEAQKAAEEAARQAARNAARKTTRSSSGTSSKSTSDKAESDDSQKTSTNASGSDILDSLFGSSANKNTDGKTNSKSENNSVKNTQNSKSGNAFNDAAINRLKEQAKTNPALANALKKVGYDVDTSVSEESDKEPSKNPGKTSKANSTNSSNTKNNSGTKSTARASSYLTGGNSDTTSSQYGAALQDPKRKTTDTSQKTTTQSMTDERAQEWRKAADQAKGDKNAAFEVVNNYLDENENARKLWDLESAADGSKAKTNARNALTMTNTEPCGALVIAHRKISKDLANRFQAA